VYRRVIHWTPFRTAALPSLLVSPPKDCSSRAILPPWQDYPALLACWRCRVASVSGAVDKKCLKFRLASAVLMTGNASIDLHRWALARDLFGGEDFSIHRFGDRPGFCTVFLAVSRGLILDSDPKKGFRRYSRIVHRRHEVSRAAAPAWSTWPMLSRVAFDKRFQHDCTCVRAASTGQGIGSLLEGPCLRVIKCLRGSPHGVQFLPRGRAKIG